MGFTSMQEREFDTTGQYVDLTREEFIRFRLLLARVNGPLKIRIPTLIMSVLCCVALVALALTEWLENGRMGYPDLTFLVGAVLVLLPGLFIYLYVPYKMKKTAGMQYDRSVEAGMNYYGLLQVYPDCIDKVGQYATAHIRLDERTLFIETPEMMVFSSAVSPALVLPARCMTPELATAVRHAADRLPARNRRFIGRLQPLSQPAIEPPAQEKPEELWVSTFTYTPEEYATVLKGIMTANYWRTAPFLATIAVLGGFTFSYDSGNLLNSAVTFLVLFGLGTLLNYVLPVSRVKRQVHTLSAHDLTMQVRLDTMMLRFKLPKGGDGYVLWCDVDHVYDKENFVEIVHNKRATLYIPKRAIPDLEALGGVINRCRGKQ